MLAERFAIVRAFTRERSQTPNGPDALACAGYSGYDTLHLGSTAARPVTIGTSGSSGSSRAPAPTTTRRSARSTGPTDLPRPRRTRLGTFAPSQATLRRGLRALGPAVVGKLKFVCSDMWQPYLKVIATQAGQALHVLDRFHITSHLNQAVDQVRRAESGRLRGQPLAKMLKKMRWQLLKRGSRVRGRARVKLNALLASKLATARAWNLKDTFEYFWHYKSPLWASAFLEYWTTRALRSRLEPMQKVARMLRAHEPLLLNWFKAKGEISSGPVEGLNNKIRVVTRRAYGFRTYKAMEIALYHTLGRLPEPESTHNFC